MGQDNNSEDIYTDQVDEDSIPNMNFFRKKIFTILTKKKRTPRWKPIKVEPNKTNLKSLKLLLSKNQDFFLLHCKHIPSETAQPDFNGINLNVVDFEVQKIVKKFSQKKNKIKAPKKSTRTHTPTRTLSKEVLCKVFTYIPLEEIFGTCTFVNKTFYTSVHSKGMLQTLKNIYIKRPCKIIKRHFKYGRTRFLIDYFINNCIVDENDVILVNGKKYIFSFNMKAGKGSYAEMASMCDKRIMKIRNVGRKNEKNEVLLFYSNYEKFRKSRGDRNAGALNLQEGEGAQSSESKSVGKGVESDNEGITS